MINPDKPFWRESPLTEPERRLLNAVLAAHALSACRQNISTVTLINALRGSLDFGKSLCSALLTLGGPHAPIEQTMRFLSTPCPSFDLEKAILAGLKVPGWGSSFHKGNPDPEWEGVKNILESDFPFRWDAILKVTEAIHRCGKIIYPNPSTYTSMAAIILEIPPSMGVSLVIHGRLGAWSAIAHRELFGGGVT